MNGPSFWTHRTENVEKLDRFRELDVSVRAESRIAKPIERLTLWKSSGGPILGEKDLRRLAQEVEAGAKALRSHTRSD